MTVMKKHPLIPCMLIMYFFFFKAFQSCEQASLNKDRSGENTGERDFSYIPKEPFSLAHCKGTLNQVDTELKAATISPAQLFIF